MKKHAISLIASLLLGACATAPFTPGPQLTLVSGTELPPPVDAGGADGHLYRVGPFDRLAVSVFGVPELSRSVQVDAAGRIALPLVGTLQAGGQTPDEISAEVDRRLRGQYVRDPQVTVNVEETVGQTVTVDGQVREPGMYPVVGRTTLMRAIALARGTTEFAQLDDVVVFRTVGGRDMAALYSLGAIRRGTYSDPEVFAHDVIVVGDSPGRRLFRDILQASPLITTPIIALLQTRN